MRLRTARRVFLAMTAGIAALLSGPGLAAGEPRFAVAGLTVFWLPYIICYAACLMLLRKWVVSVAFSIGIGYLGVAGGVAVFWPHTGPYALLGVAALLTLVSLALLAAALVGRLALCATATRNSRTEVPTA